jgi:hypothetical protein
MGSKILKGIGLGLIDKIPFVGKRIGDRIDEKTTREKDYIGLALLIIAVLGFLFAVFKVITPEDLKVILDLF